MTDSKTPDSGEDFIPAPYDADLSHGQLVAVLMANGGTLDVPAEFFHPDELGTPDGRLHGVAMGPSPDGLHIRLQVVPNPHREDLPRQQPK